MKSNLYIFRDVVSGKFGEPFTATCDEEVRRSFAGTCGVCDNPFTKHTLTDTECLHIGFFDSDHSPVVTGCDVRRILYGFEQQYQDILQLAMDSFYDGGESDA